MTNKSKKKDKVSNKNKIIDIPFAGKIHKGTNASHGDIEYQYQNYSNILNFFRNIKLKLCLFDNSFINLDIDDLGKGIFTIYDLKIFIKNINKCIKYKHNFIPVVFNLISSEGNHANILLINKKNKTIELFEPHGSRTSSSTLGGVVGIYRKKLKELNKFWKNILSDYSVINSVDYQSGTAFQAKYDPENHSGYCVSWTILFVHYRLLNPNTKLDILIKYISDKITTKKLLQYTKYIEENIKSK